MTTYAMCIASCMNDTREDESTCADLCDDEPQSTADDDPICVCGTHLSEHALCGCERFQTPKDYEASKRAYSNMSDDERWALDEYEANGGIIY